MLRVAHSHLLLRVGVLVLDIHILACDHLLLLHQGQMIRVKLFVHILLLLHILELLLEHELVS